MTAIKATLIGAAIGAAALGLPVMSASAAIVCTGNACWHTHESYEYPPAAKIVVHDDNWKWDRHAKYRWREHEGRGYWSGRRWTAW